MNHTPMKKRGVGFASLESALDELLGGVQVRARGPEPRLRLLWHEVCGPQIAEQTRVVGVEGERLLIEVSPLWMSALYEAHRELLARLRHRSGLRELRFLEVQR